MKINEVIAEKIYTVTGADGKVTYTDRPSTHQGKVAVDKPGRLNIVGSNASNIKYQARKARAQEKRAGNPGAKVADWTGKTNEADLEEYVGYKGPGKEFAPPTPKDFLPKKPKLEADGDLTSSEDIVLSKNGDQAVRDLKLSDQEIELLKAVALGWADYSDLGDLEQDIFDYWFENNPEDYNPVIQGGGGDPSDTIMDELESWFEDKDPDQARFDAEFKASSDRIARDAIDDEKTLTPFKYSKGEKITDWADPETTAAAKRDTKKVQRTGTHANRKWAVGEEREDDAPSTRTSGFTKSAGSDLQGLIKQEPANAKELKGKKRALKFKLPQTINMPFDDDEEHVSTLLGSEEGAPTIDDLARMLKLAGV